MAQAVQPSWRFHNAHTNSKSSWRMFYDHCQAFDGGSALRVVGQMKEATKARLTLFHFASPGVGDQNDGTLLFSLTFKETEHMEVACLLENEDQRMAVVCCAPNSDPQQWMEDHALIGEIPCQSAEISRETSINGWQQVTWSVPAVSVDKISLLCQPRWSSWMSDSCMEASEDLMPVTVTCLLGSVRLGESPSPVRNHLHSPLRDIRIEPSGPEESERTIRWTTSENLRCVDIYLRSVHTSPQWISRVYRSSYTISGEERPPEGSCILVLVPQDHLGHPFEPVSVLFD